MFQVFFLSAALLLTFSGRSQTHYQPPYFEDSLGRIERIRATQAVVDQLFREHAAKHQLPGFVYGVVVDGQLLYSGSTGYAQVSQKIPVTISSAFRIASMTKSFTTLAIVKLRDEGKIQLDDPASKYIPEMKQLNYLTTDAPAITVRHLLNHLAGFPEDNPWGDRQLADTDQDLLDLVKNDISFSNVPGIHYEYSNLGYALLGRIISQVTGQPYQQYITTAILKPLGMHHTYWDYKQVPAAQLAHGYRRQQGQWQEEPLLADGSYGAMGGLITTVEDFTRYMALHMSAWPPRNGAEHPVLKRSSLREMQTRGSFSSLMPSHRYPDGRACAITSMYAYGLGWTRDCEGKVWIGHSGGLPGFGSNWRFYPDYGIGIVCFANLTYAPASAFNLAVMDTVIRMARLKPRKIPVSDILEKRKQQLVQLLPHWNHALSSGIFAENFFPDNPLDSMKKITADIFSRAGRIIRVHELQPQNQLRGSFIIEAERGDIEIFFTLSPEKNPLIQQLNVRERKKP